MFASFLAATKQRAGLAVLLIGWIVMAVATRTQAIQSELPQLSMFVVGFALLIGALVLMIMTEG